MTILSKCGSFAHLHYEITPGPAPVLMLSNSLGTDTSMWEPQLAEFSRHFTVLRYDTRGHGRSHTPTGPYTIVSMAEDAIALLDHLQIETIHFCGLSLGGMVGQWLGVHRPERLRSLVLCNTGAKIGTEEGWNARIEAVRTCGMTPVVAAVLDRWFTPHFRNNNPETIAKVTEVLRRTDPSGYAAACAAVRDMDQRDDVRDIRVETLVVAGTQDAVTTVADAQFLAGAIPQAQLCALDAAHLSNIQAAEAFTEAVLKFLLKSKGV